MKNLRIFGLGASHNFARQIRCWWANYSTERHMLNAYHPDRHHEERRPDGEAFTTALDNVRGCDVFVVSSLYGSPRESVDEKLMKAAIFINTLRHASADRITLVAPYLAYMRQDQKQQSRAPIATQAIAMMLEAVGLDRLLTMDVHNLGAEQNAFRIPMDNLEARKLLADTIVQDIGTCDHDDKFAWKVLTPDAGGTSRTKLMQQSLSKRLKQPVGIVYADKTRIDSDNVRVTIVGDVSRCNVIAVDDMISTGGTIAEVANATEKAGGFLWGVVATHGLFVNSAPEKLANVPRIYTTDTVSPFRMKGTPAEKNLRVTSTASLFAQAIKRIHEDGGSISGLLSD